MRALLLFLFFCSPAFGQNYPLYLTPQTPNFFSINNQAPTGTVSGTPIMMGLGSVCKITPGSTGVVQFSFYGAVTNSTTSDGWILGGSYGTGAAPANGVAGTGTIFGTPMQSNVAVGADVTPFAYSGVASGLAAGVPLWFDIRLNAVTAGTASVNFVTCTAQELH
jgi:hypothetical protein